MSNCRWRKSSKSLPKVEFQYGGRVFLRTEVIVICRPSIENLRYLIEIWSAKTCTYLLRADVRRPTSISGDKKNRPINISHEQSSVVKTWRNRRIRRRRTRRCGFSCFVTCMKRMLSVNPYPKVQDLRRHGRHLENSIWRYNSASGGSIWIRYDDKKLLTFEMIWSSINP